MRPPSTKPLRCNTLTLTMIISLIATDARAAETYAVGSTADPKVRAASFLDQEKRYYSALTELLAAQGGRGGDPHPDLRDRLRETYLSFGMHGRAVGVTDGSASVKSPNGKALSALELAQFEYQRGYIDEARTTLRRAQSQVPRNLEGRWADLLARVLMSQDRYREAVDVLDSVDVRQDPQGFLRYNLGIALMADGRTSDACAILDRVGRLETSDRVTSTLRDRANVTLGWHFLQQQLGGAARPLLLRVSSEGPYSSRALLGLGWAELAPAGREQTRADLGIRPTTSGRLRADPGDPLSSLSPLGVLMRNVPLDDPSERRGRIALLANSERVENDSMRRALMAWSLIVDRDGDDPAVHEAWLAVPYVLDKLGAHTQAAERYELAVKRLDTAHERLASITEALRSDRMIETLADTSTDEEAGWKWSVRHLPDVPETYLLQTLIADHPFNEALKNYRDTRLIERWLSSWEDRLDQMTSAFDVAGQPPVDPSTFIARARQRGRSPYRGEPVKLIEELQLGVPRSSRRIGHQESRSATSLQLSTTPAHFDGRWERLQGLHARLDALKPIVSKLRAESANQLQRLALDELGARSKQLDRYRGEARFALARLYDRAVPIPDQDEFELLDGGVRPWHLERGEHEIEKGGEKP